jgi:hypothetical protein
MLIAKLFCRPRLEYCAFYENQIWGTTIFHEKGCIIHIGKKEEEENRNVLVDTIQRLLVRYECLQQQQHCQKRKEI